ncbi:MAG: hypothetical protein HC805_06535 [Alkalinema sp. RL_2_19]|nr:hypothetical protein [Alkalinema sp. RL_2_19]
MAIETWFPLAIYSEDLAAATEHNPGMLETILDLEASGFERRAYDDMAWTGDLHGVQRIHLDSRFGWIVSQVEQHTIAYLTALGVDLSQVALHIQRAWPIVSRQEQAVGDHLHNTAHVSAVYYVSVPAADMGDPGSLVFLDDARVNEVCPGLGSENTNVVDEANFYNQLQAVYPPVEGRLLLFPAKQRHGVTPNETEDLRVSLSFDIVLTAKPGEAAGSHEFLMPPVEQWSTFGSG